MENIKTYNHLIKDWLEKNTNSKDQWAVQEEKLAELSKKHHEHNRIVMEERKKFLKQMEKDKQQKEVQAQKVAGYPKQRSNISNLYKPKEPLQEEKPEIKVDLNFTSPTKKKRASSKTTTSEGNFMSRRRELQNTTQQPQISAVQFTPDIVKRKTVVTTTIGTWNSLSYNSAKKEEKQESDLSKELQPLQLNKQSRSEVDNKGFNTAPKIIPTLQKQSENTNINNLQQTQVSGTPVIAKSSINFYNKADDAKRQTDQDQAINEMEESKEEANESDDEYDAKWPKKIVKKVIYLDNNDCAICMMPLAENGIRRRLRCNHAFHSRCIDIWFQSSKNCPTCRQRARQ